MNVVHNFAWLLSVSKNCKKKPQTPIYNKSEDVLKKKKLRLTLLKDMS